MRMPRVTLVAVPCRVEPYQVATYPAAESIETREVVEGAIEWSLALAVGPSDWPSTWAAAGVDSSYLVVVTLRWPCLALAAEVPVAAHRAWVAGVDLGGQVMILVVECGLYVVVDVVVAPFACSSRTISHNTF